MEEKISSEMRQAVQSLLQIGVPLRHAGAAVARSLASRDTLKEICEPITPEQKATILLEYVDELITMALMDVFSISEESGVSRQEAAEIILSGLLTHAATGCLMMTPNLETGHGMYEKLSDMAFSEASKVSDSVKKNAQEVMKAEEEKKDATIH